MPFPCLCLMIPEFSFWSNTTEEPRKWNVILFTKSESPPLARIRTHTHVQILLLSQTPTLEILYQPDQQMCTCLHSCRNNSLFQSIQSSKETGWNVMGKVRKYLQKTVHKMKGRTRLLNCTKHMTWRRNSASPPIRSSKRLFFFFFLIFAKCSGWKRGLTAL